jgi:putative colanic acid biosynthesis UDP-glucose lipid carrier transferase
MKKPNTNYSYIRYLNDALVILVAYLGTLFTLFQPAMQFFSFYFLALTFFLWYLMSNFSKLYADRRSNKFSEEIIFIFYHIILFAIVLSSSLFFLQPGAHYNFKFFIYFLSYSFLLATITKYILRKNRHAAFYQGKFYDSILLIGDTPAAHNFADTVKKYFYYGYQCVGILAEEQIYQLEKKLLSTHIDEVVIALPNDKYSLIQQCIDICDAQRTKVRILPDFRQYATSSVYINNIGRVPVMNVGGLPLDRWENKLLKRSFDILFSLVFFLTIGIILFPVVALLIKLSSKGPVFFKQERWGLNNKLIICYKFRTMVQDSKDVDEDGKYQQAQKDDPRITSIGRILRKTNLDEIPQFWNVLIGNMSVVGPRPHPTPLNKESMHTVDNYMLRHIVLPGITGWAQVNGCRGETKTVEEMQERVDFDLSYIHRWTFWLDCQIILQTIINLIRGDQNAY